MRGTLKRHNEKGERVVYGPFFEYAQDRTCVGCGTYPCVPHHVKSVGSGGKDANNLLDVCYQCHQLIETHGLEEWENRTGVDAQEAVHDLWKEYSKFKAYYGW